MAAVLTSLVDQVDKQNKTIGDLQNSLSLYVTNQTYVERISKLESVVSDMCTRIDAIQEAATATVLNKKYVLYLHFMLRRFEQTHCIFYH